MGNPEEADGAGTLVEIPWSCAKATYSGSIQRGKPNGMGVIKFDNETKDMYIGEMLYGKMHGKGTLTYGGDTVLRGEFFENLYVV